MGVTSLSAQSRGIQFAAVDAVLQSSVTPAVLGNEAEVRQRS